MKKNKKARKITAMHEAYGENEGSSCGRCCNLIHKQIEGERFKGVVCKCIAYGAWHSQETDWNENYTGCGLYNTPFKETGKSQLYMRLK